MTTKNFEKKVKFIDLRTFLHCKLIQNEIIRMVRSEWT